MNLREEIEKEHSRAQAVRVADMVLQDPGLLPQLMSLFLNGTYRMVQRSAWPLSLIAERRPDLLVPHLEQLVNRMSGPGVPVAVKRNVVRLLQYTPVPEMLHGQVMHTCFSLLEDPQETVAVRCHCMTVLDMLSVTYPDIRPELTALIRNQLELGATAGFRARARKILGNG